MTHCFNKPHRTMSKNSLDIMPKHLERIPQILQTVVGLRGSRCTYAIAAFLTKFDDLFSDQLYK